MGNAQFLFLDFEKITEDKIIKKYTSPSQKFQKFVDQKTLSTE